jgi:hypothetical protein
VAAFFFDNDADMRIARSLRRFGHTITSAAEQHLSRVSDSELLHYAGRAGLILVTHNERDFTRLHDQEPPTHAGIIAVPQEAPENLDAAASAIDGLVNAGHPLAGACYRLRSEGWERRTDQRGWERL